MRRVGFVLLFLLWQSCAWAREVHLTIVATTDLHGHVLPTEDYEGQADLGGIARCATVIRQIRAQNSNALLVDAGDTFQGTAIGYLSGGQVMVKVLNALHYDAWVWGNHEFDWGLEKLAACAASSKVPILNANLQAASTAPPADSAAARILSRRQSYVLRDVDGVKVGIIGLNTPGIPHWSRPELIQGLQVRDSVETLRAVVPALKQAGAQVLVLVCHQGYRESGDDHANQINAIARNFPELDVIVGGHTHRDFPEFEVGHVLYCEAGYFGIDLGRVDLVFDTDQGRVVRRSAKTMRMDGQVPLDDTIVHLVGGEIDQAQKVLGTVIGEAGADFDLRGAPRRETPVHDLIFDSVAEELRDRGVRVDGIVHGILERRGTIEKGAVTIGDIWKIMPYENTLGCCELSRSDLLAILEEDAAVYGRWDFRGISGLRWTFDPAAPEGHRTISLTHADGSSIGAEERLVIAFNSYDLAGGGLRWKKLREIADRPESKLQEYDCQTRQAVIDYVRRRGTITPAIKGWWRAENGQKEEGRLEDWHGSGG